MGSRPVKRKKIVYYTSNNNSNYFLLPSKSYDIELKLFNGIQPFFFFAEFLQVNSISLETTCSAQDIKSLSF